MRRRSLSVSLLAAALTVSALGSGAVAAASPPERFFVSPTGSFVVQARGNGHGHGMSQYGARGAAIEGRSYAQILAFYYPGTSLATLAPSSIRVGLSGYGSTVTVGALPPLAVTGVSGVLPSKGVWKYRLVPAGSGLALQQLLAAKGSVWRTFRTGLPDGASFSGAAGAPVRLFRADTVSTFYQGSVSAVRSGAGLFPVNRTPLDSYVAGVVPRESPASWPIQALDAQAVAARSYARYEIEHTAPGSAYDICDSSACQVYGGSLHLDNHDNVLWRDFPAAAVNTAGKVLRYRGNTAFTQFSASNGGWSTDGGQPYLAARSDPYDSAVSDDPYLLTSYKVGVAALARQFGFGQLHEIVVTQRDGHGAWGGRVLRAVLEGFDTQHRIITRAVSGFDLQDALGLGTTWLLFRAG